MGLLITIAIIIFALFKAVFNAFAHRHTAEELKRANDEIERLKKKTEKPPPGGTP